MHFDKIFFPHYGFYDISQILSDWVAKGFAPDLTRILNGKLYF